jgi:hypothetical protein
MGTASPQNWSEFEAQRLVGAGLVHPLTTEEVRSVCENDTFRVEQNRVRVTGLDEAREAIRAVSLDDTHYEAVLVPMLDDGRLLLVNRYRYAIERWSVEFPRFAGQTSDEGWKHSVEENLRKRIGMTSGKMTLLGGIYPDAATTAISTIVILAEGCAQQGPMATDPRDLVAGAFGETPDEINRLVRRGEITCGVTLAALALYGCHGRA